MLNNELCWNYGVPAARLWGIPGPGSGPCGSKVKRGGARVWGGRVLNMEMALIYPRPKLDYSVTSLMAQAHCVCLYQQSKGGNYLSLKLLSFLLLPGGRPGPFCSYYSRALVPFILFQIKCPSRWEEGGNSVYFILKDSSVDSDVWIRHWSADVMCVWFFSLF